jgi:hypothetical protein
MDNCKLTKKELLIFEKVRGSSEVYPFNAFKLGYFEGGKSQKALSDEYDLSVNSVVKRIERGFFYNICVYTFTHYRQ